MRTSPVVVLTIVVAPRSRIGRVHPWVRCCAEEMPASPSSRRIDTPARSPPDRASDVVQGAGCVHVGLPRHRARRRETLVDIPPACGPGVAHCRRWTRHRHDSLNESSSLAELPVTRATGCCWWFQEPCVARDSGRSSNDHRPENRHTPGTNVTLPTGPIDRAKQRNRLPTCEDVRPRRSSFAATREHRRRCRHHCSQNRQKNASSSGVSNTPHSVPCRVQWRLGTDASTVVGAGLCR